MGRGEWRKRSDFLKLWLSALALFPPGARSRGADALAHTASGNMAALLRSARLLKFSPSGLLQIAGTKRIGPASSRLYSGAVGGCGTGVCFRQRIPAAEHASR